MKRTFAATLTFVPLVPVMLGALAVPASAASDQGICKSLFNTPAKHVRTVTAGAYVMPAESEGTLIDKYSYGEGESVAIKACVIYDVDRDGQLDKGEGIASNNSNSSFPDNGNGEWDYAIDAYSIRVPQSPADGQLCWRTSFTLTRIDGSTSTDITSTCFRADYLPY